MHGYMKEIVSGAEILNHEFNRLHLIITTHKKKKI